MNPTELESSAQVSCSCDPDCLKYADCCSDSKHYNATEQAKNLHEFECLWVHSSFSAYYMRTRCPLGYPDKFLAAKCEKSLREVRDEPLDVAPVTSLSTRTTYGNVYCAVCNNDTSSVVEASFWHTGISCPALTDDLVASHHLTRNLTYDEQNNTWSVFVNDTVYQGCYPNYDIHLPRHLKSQVRRCLMAESDCPVGFLDKEIVRKCHATFAHVYTSFRVTPYRSIYCAVCNQHLKPGDTNSCSSEYNVIPSFAPSPSFSILLDFSSNGGLGAGTVGHLCKEGQIYDPFFRKCRTLFCVGLGMVLEGDKCVKAEGNVLASVGTDADEGDRAAQKFANCPKVLLTSDEFEHGDNDNGTLVVPVYGQTYNSSQFRYDGLLQVVLITFSLYQISKLQLCSKSPTL